MPSDHNIFSNTPAPDKPDAPEPSEAELSFRGKTQADLSEGIDIPPEFKDDFAILLSDLQAARGLRGGAVEPTFEQARASYVDTHKMLRTAILELSGELPVDPQTDETSPEEPS